MREVFPISGILRFLEKEKDFVFLESTRVDAENYLSYIFLRPQKIVSTYQIEAMEDCFGQLEQALAAGDYVAGFVSYEAGAAFEPRLRQSQTYNFPLVWFGVYPEAFIYNHCQGRFTQNSQRAGALIKEINSYGDIRQKKYSLKNIRPNITQSAYAKAIRKIKGLIARGFTYQVNYTFKLKFSFSGSTSALYYNLRNRQNVGYASFIRAGGRDILSFSPELFFRKKGRAICVRPMKGTSPRGRHLAEDGVKAAGLKNCRKNRSENLMIVDLLRNDLGRISRIGSVTVSRLFNVERYRTLFQMTSDIKGRLKSGYSPFAIFRHIFPSGSVTGAPKIKTMEIIGRLEREPRNIYTGGIGFFSPQGLGAFNVAIRTLLIDRRNKKGELGVGSGIVYDSYAKSEYAECRLKADFLVKPPADFQLLETILWQPDSGYTFLPEHLKRLENSASYFEFLYRRDAVLEALDKLQQGFQQRHYKVRLLLLKDGRIKSEAFLLETNGQARPRVYLAKQRVSSRNLFFYHKTTNRKLYDAEYQRCRRRGYYDVLFTNERGEVTEGAISNIFITKKGKIYTPPQSCGLLDGIYRRHLLDSIENSIQEKILYQEDLKNAEAIYLSNSVRGLVRVYLEKHR